MDSIHYYEYARLSQQGDRSHQSITGGFMTSYERPKKRSSQRRSRRGEENSDVLVSAVVSTYLLTHLHHVLQRAEFGASEAGRDSQAANYAQLRKVLCLDARSMKDASALGSRDDDQDLAA